MTNLEEEKEVQVNSQVRESRTPTREDYEALNKVEEEVFKQRKHMFLMQTHRSVGDAIEAHGGEQPFVNRLGASALQSFYEYRARAARGKIARELNTALEKDREKKQLLTAFHARNRPARQESKYTEEEIEQKVADSDCYTSCISIRESSSIKKVTRYISNDELFKSHIDYMGNVFAPNYWGRFKYESVESARKDAEEILSKELPRRFIDEDKLQDLTYELLRDDFNKDLAVQNEAAREQYIEQMEKSNLISESIPDWVQKATLFLAYDDPNILNQALLDFAQNIPNLLTSYVSVAAGEALAGPFGAVAGHGVSYMALAEQEYSGFLESVDPFVLDYNLDIDLAYKYAELYGAISGIIEHSEQLLNIASIGGTGKAGAAMAKMFPTEKLYGRVLKWAAGVGINMVSEGFEEVSQQALQHYFTAQMLQSGQNDIGQIPR